MVIGHWSLVIRRNQRPVPNYQCLIMKKFLLISALALLSSVLVFDAIAQERAELSGRVIDEESGEPLAGVHVFLASRLQGTTTDVDGYYAIRGVAPGSYKVVASIIGYESVFSIVGVEGEQQLEDVDFSLAPAVYELGGVVVTEDEPRLWKKQLKRFRELYLGTSGNTKQTEIVNAYVLSFREDEDNFEAFASEPLEIENRSTGYRLKFVLDRFYEDREEGLRYTVGTWRFEELEPEDEKEEKSWAEQRELTFKGSLQHLLWSMVHLKTEAEGFSLLRDFREDGEAPELFLTKYHPVDERTILRKSSTPYEYKIRFADFIRVHYLRTGDKRRLFGKRPPPVEQLSYLKMNNEDEVTIHESGYMYTPAGSEGAITVFGYLAALGVADLLPQEYALQRK